MLYTHFLILLKILYVKNKKNILMIEGNCVNVGNDS